MKRVTILSIVLLILSGSLLSQQSKPEAALIALEKRSWEAWQKRDGRFFAGFLSDDHVEVGRSGVAGKSAIVDFVANPICKVNGYKVEQFKVTMFDKNMALLTYHSEQDTTCGGAKVPSPAWVSSLYVKRNGRWLNALYQQTPITK